MMQMVMMIRIKNVEGCVSVTFSRFSALSPFPSPFSISPFLIALMEKRYPTPPSPVATLTCRFCIARPKH